MISEWRYRAAALAGVACLTTAAVLLANQPAVQSLFVGTPIAGRLLPVVLDDEALTLAVGEALLVAAVAFSPLYKPRPRRVIDAIVLTEERVLLFVLALATVGFFDYTYRLPRTTLLLTAALQAVLLPAWFVAIRRRMRTGEGTAIIVGDDVRRFPRLRELADRRVVGYVSPMPSPTAPDAGRPVTDGGEPATGGGDPATGEGASTAVDGGRSVVVEPPDAHFDIERLGGLSRLDGTLVDYDPDVAILAFVQPDRQEFFGTLYTCHQHGVTAKIPSDHVDSVLPREGAEPGGLVTIDLEPWDPQDVALKRAFDVAFAALGLVALAPVMLAIALAIVLDDGGPVFYSQRRTSSFGETHTVYKFRTMAPGGEDETPVDDEENDRITRVGRILRRSHLDEIPQLLTILSGEMSVVGPRAAWTDEESLLEAETVEWRKRWFVKPGLTGLAQVNDVSSTSPEAKLRYDVEYIRRQSFRFDLQIVGRQVEQVLGSLLELVEDARDR